MPVFIGPSPAPFRLRESMALAERALRLLTRERCSQHQIRRPVPAPIAAC